MILLWNSTHSTIAQSLPFPPAGTDAAMAANRFSARATGVIETNACSREDDYLKYRTAMAAGDFSSGTIEDLSHILLAKIAFIRARTSLIATHSPEPCIGQIFRVQNVGDVGKVSLEKFAEADRGTRAAGPTACAVETDEILQPVKKDSQNNTILPQGVFVKVSVSQQCMARQVNEAILAMKKTNKMGSSSLPCFEEFNFAGKENDGEFDVSVRELTRILYFGGGLADRQGGILKPETVDYMYQNLLAARGKLSDPSYSIFTGCSEPAGDELGSPEDTADRHAWYRDVADALGDFFDWALFTYLTYVAVPGGGVLAAAPFLIAAAGGDPGDILAHWDIKIPETENHRLNIESSKYLINADIIARLQAENYDRVDEVREDQAEVRNWLMRRLQDIAAHDFQEYNARPYTRYSLNSILNLFDFAERTGDKPLSTAAGIVLDLSGAKFAATSNRGRRIVPFRRRSENDVDVNGSLENRSLFEVISAGDYEVARAMLLAGQTQALDPNVDSAIDMGRGKQLAALAQMVNSATSGYRLPTPALAAAVERGNFEQTILHTGVERVEQSPAFTISAGGIRTVPTATVSFLDIHSASDRGAAMPTVVIPTLGGAYVRELFRFEGIGEHDQRTDNTCVAPGFACGFEPGVSTFFSPCTTSEPTPEGSIHVVSSAACFPESPGPHFYLAMRIAACLGSFCARGLQWGLLDIVEASPPPAVKDKDNVLRAAPDPAFVRFKSERIKALNAVTPDRNGTGTYTTAAGLRIVFSLIFGQPPANSGRELGRAPTVLSINGAPPPSWATAGGVIDADGKGRATIKGHNGPITIDFSDWNNPKRSP